MSSELRLKKLRGSGGYIMANVTDEQQQKGNLGGPDLFLAPVGRLDSGKISKYFCNTCEKDYEGSPKIEYDNPNEEVAENLILIEKGQYICTTCGSTLAEYREFQKPNEQGGIGTAKPLTPNTSYETASTDLPPVPEPTQTQNEPPLTIPTFDDQPAYTQSSSSDVQSQSVSSFSSISGMAVYDENAKRIGTAKQVGVDSSQNVVLVITNNDGNDVTIPWSNIRRVGEIVLLGAAGGSGSTAQTQSGKCSSCGFANKEGSKFCEQCGTKL